MSTRQPKPKDHAVVYLRKDGALALRIEGKRLLRAPPGS